MNTFFEVIFRDSPKIIVPLAILVLCIALQAFILSLFSRNRLGFKKVEYLQALFLTLPTLFVILKIYKEQICGPHPSDLPAGSNLYYAYSACTHRVENIATLSILATSALAVLFFLWRWAYHKTSTIWLKSISLLIILNFFAANAVYLTLIVSSFFYDIE